MPQLVAPPVAATTMLASAYKEAYAQRAVTGRSTILAEVPGEYLQLTRMEHL